MRVPYVCVYSIIAAAVLPTGTGCNNPLEAENATLKKQNIALQSEVARLNGAVKKLQETDQFYYRKAVEQRRAKQYAKSTSTLREMLQKFTQISLRNSALATIKANTDDPMKAAFATAMSAYNGKKYEDAAKGFATVIARYQSNPLASRALSLKRTITRRIAEREEAQRRAEEQELRRVSEEAERTAEAEERECQTENCLLALAQRRFVCICRR